jgi:hypothetical protein
VHLRSASGGVDDINAVFLRDIQRYAPGATGRCG